MWSQMHNEKERERHTLTYANEQMNNAFSLYKASYGHGD